jgi:hypothetical protein
MKTLLLSILLMHSTLISAYDSFEENLNDLEMSKPVKKFFEKNGANPDLFTESCVDFDDCDSFNYHTKDYKFMGDAASSFRNLIAMSPDQAWIDSSQFEVGFDPKTRIYYGLKSSYKPSIEVGQIFFLNLTVAGLLHMPVAFKIVEVNFETNTIAFSYLKQNKSNGIQRIIFKQNGPEMIVQHETKFKSNSNFRDSLLYRKFHEDLLDDFWQKIESKIVK